MSLIVLVRHGQASWGAKDYDALTPLGIRQAEATGRWLSKRDIRPAVLIAGRMSRQQGTAGAIKAAAGWDNRIETDPGWNEYDHLGIIHAHKPAYRSRAVMRVNLLRTLRPHKAFDVMYETATARWVDGEHESDYVEPYSVFTARVDAALARLVARLAPADTAVVCSSAGAISWILAQALDAGPQTWTRLQRVITNTSVSTIRVGARGLHVMTFNEHRHLEVESGLLTYR